MSYPTVPIASTPLANNTWNAVQGIEYAVDVSTKVMLAFNQADIKKYNYDTGAFISENTDPFADLSFANPWRFSDSCELGGVIYALVHSVGVTPELQHLVKYDLATLAFISDTFLGDNNAIGGAGVGVSSAGNTLVVCGFFTADSDPLARRITEIDLNGVILNQLNLSRFIYGMQGITYNPSDSYYYISSHDTINSFDGTVKVLASTLEVQAYYDPTALTLEAEGVTYDPNTSNILTHEINGSPVSIDFSTTPIIAQFPADFTLLRTLETNTALIVGSSTDLVLEINQDAFGTDVGSIFTALNTLGGDIRLSTDELGAQRIAIDTVFFNNSTQTCNIKFKLSVDNATSVSVYLWGATSLLNVSPALSDDPFGSFEVWSDQQDQFNFYSADSSANLESLTLTNGSSVSGGNLLTPSASSATQTDSNQFEGQSNITLRVKGNTGNLTITGDTSPHRFFDKNGGVLTMGLTVSHFAAWNQGWSSIPFAAGDNADIDIVATYDNSEYRLYNMGDLVGSVSKTQVTGSGVGDLIIGNNTATGSANWPGSMSEIGYSYTTASANEIKTQSNNSLMQLDFWAGSDVSIALTSTMPSMMSNFSINHLAPVREVSVASVMPSAISTMSLSQTLPQYSASISSIMPSMESSFSLSTGTPTYSATIISTMPSMSSSISLTVSDPVSVSASIESIMPSMVSSLRLINGEISEIGEITVSFAESDISVEYKR